MASILLFLVIFVFFILAFYAYLIWNISNQEMIYTNEIYYVRTKDLWEIRVCRYRNNSEKSIPVLFVHGFGSNQNNFLLPHEHSIVDYLKKHNFDCWTFDYRGCKSSKPPFGKTRWDAEIDDILIYDLPAVIEFILKMTGNKKLFWVGHSLGGMLLYAYLLHHGKEKIAGGITLGAPIGFAQTNIHIPSFLIQLQKLSPNFIFLLFRMLIPILKIFRVGNSVFPVNPSNIHPAMTAWDLCRMVEPPSPRMTETMVQWTKEQKWVMLKGKLNVLEHLHEIDIPILLFFAPDDPFVNIETAKNFFNSLQSKDKEMVILSQELGYTHNYNHCDLAFGEQGDIEVFEPIRLWLEKHEDCLYSSNPSRTATKSEKKQSGRLPLTKEERKTILSGKAYKKATRQKSIEPTENIPNTEEIQNE